MEGYFEEGGFFLEEGGRRKEEGEYVRVLCRLLQSFSSIFSHISSSFLTPRLSVSFLIPHSTLHTPRERYRFPIESSHQCALSSPRSSTFTCRPSDRVMVFHCPRLAGMASMVAQHNVAWMVNTILARGFIFSILRLTDYFPSSWRYPVGRVFHSVSCGNG